MTSYSDRTDASQKLPDDVATLWKKTEGASARTGRQASDQ